MPLEISLGPGELQEMSGSSPHAPHFMEKWHVPIRKNLTIGKEHTIHLVHDLVMQRQLPMPGYQHANLKETEGQAKEQKCDKKSRMRKIWWNTSSEEGGNFECTRNKDLLEEKRVAESVISQKF